MFQNSDLLNQFNHAAPVRKALMQNETSKLRKEDNNNKRTYVRSIECLYLRFGIIGAALFLLLISGGVFSAFGGQTDAYAASPESGNIRYVFVEEGDTIWSIAAKHAPAGRDVRSYIDTVKYANGLTSVTVRIGQKLILP